MALILSQVNGGSTGMFFEVNATSDPNSALTSKAKSVYLNVQLHECVCIVCFTLILVYKWTCTVHREARASHYPLFCTILSWDSISHWHKSLPFLFRISVRVKGISSHANFLHVWQTLTTRSTCFRAIFFSNWDISIVLVWLFGSGQLGNERVFSIYTMMPNIRQGTST